MTVDIEDLERLAKASCASWEACPQLNRWYHIPGLFDALEDDADAAFIAAASPSAVLALIAEVRELRAKTAPPVYPDTLSDGQRVMPPTAAVRVVITPSGFAERIYGGRLDEYERLIRYVLAPPAPPESP